jgi:hypothetical protein
VLKRLTLILGLSITALAVLLAAAGPPVLSQARDLVFDAYQRSSPRAFDPDAPVHIVDIDEAALDAYGQWPWPRSYLAALTDRLFDHGAAAVGYDVLFAEPDRTSPERIAESWSRFRDGIPPVLPDLGLPPHDQVFAAAIAGRPVVLSVAGGQEGEVPAPLAGIAVTGARAAGPGAVSRRRGQPAGPDGGGGGAGHDQPWALRRRGDADGAAGQRGGRDADARVVGGASARGAGGRRAHPAHHRRLRRGFGRNGGRRGHAHRRAELPGGGRRRLPHPLLRRQARARHPRDPRAGGRGVRPRACRARLGAHRPGRLLRAGALRHPHHAARPGGGGRGASCRDHRTDRVGAIPVAPRLDAGAGNRDRGAERAVADASAAEGAALS